MVASLSAVSEAIRKSGEDSSQVKRAPEHVWWVSGAVSVLVRGAAGQLSLVGVVAQHALTMRLDKIDEIR
jgi:hypothetical protein